MIRRSFTVTYHIDSTSHSDADKIAEFEIRLAVQTFRSTKFSEVKLATKFELTIANTKYYTTVISNLPLTIIETSNMLLLPLKVCGVLPFQRHSSPLSGSIWYFHYYFFIIVSLRFFLITVFTNISFVSLLHLYFSYHYSSWVDFSFLFQHSLGCF